MIDKTLLLKVIDERSEKCFNPLQNEFDIGYARALFHLKSDIIRGELDFGMRNAIKATEPHNEVEADKLPFTDLEKEL